MTQPLIWLRAVRDREGLRQIGTAGQQPAVRFAVLSALAVRLNRDGTGTASLLQLSADVQVSTDAVRAAVAWAVQAGMLDKTEPAVVGRGAATRWHLLDPDETREGDTHG